MDDLLVEVGHRPLWRGSGAASLLLHHLDQPHVDVLPAAGLVAVDRDHVLARLQRLAPVGRQRHLDVVGGVAGTFAASTPLM